MVTAGDRLQDTMESMALQRTWHRLFAETDAASAEQLTEAEYRLLAVISKHGSASASALGAAVGLDRSRVSRVADRLVDDGLLHRTADPADGRATLLALTGRGHTAVAQRRTSMARRLDVIAGGWPAGAAARFADGGGRIVAEFDGNKRPPAPPPPPAEGEIEVEPTELTAAERQVFHSALRIVDTLRSRVARDVHPITGLSTPEFLVLTRLREFPGHSHSGLRALAAKLGWSPSRLSHQLGRMERRQLIRRVPDTESGQVTISMTADAEQSLEKAIALHAAAVRRHLLSHVSEEQAVALVALAESITRAPDMGIPMDDDSRPWGDEDAD